MRAAVILLLVAAATAQRFVLPPGHADILAYCNATYAYMDRADIAALDAKYDRLAPGVTPFNASGGQPVCTLGCEIGLRAATSSWAGKCWGIDGAPTSQCNCNMKEFCTVEAAKKLPSGMLAAGVVAPGTNPARWQLLYPAGSDGAKTYDLLEKMQLPGMPSGGLAAAYYAQSGARSWRSYHDEFKQLAQGVWTGRVYVDRADGTRKLARRFIFFLQ